MILFLLIFALAFANPQQSNPAPDDRARLLEQAKLQREHHRQAAIQMNELAGRIQSDADALALVDGIADIFADHLPPAWTTRNIRERVAHAEYEAVSDASRLIPDQRVAEVWNRYVREIGAPEEAVVSAAEIHSMRDASYAVSQLMWTQEWNQTIWTMPNIYAIGADGKVADGCRAVESLRVIYDLDKMFDNLRSARERLQKGIVASDDIEKRLENPNPSRKATGRLEARVDTNPLRPAEYRYVLERGAENFNRLLESLFDELLPASKTPGSEAR